MRGRVAQTLSRLLPRRSHRALAGLLLGLAALAAGGLSRDAGAQQTGAASAAQTPLEQEALTLYQDEQLIGARTKAEEALEQNPNSLVGHYVLGCVLHEAEGSLARAMFHLGRARELYETTWSASTRPAGAPWELHREILYHIQGLAGEMELHEYRLQVLGYHDYLYDPDLLAEHAWPLMRLGRYDEAREFAQRAAASRRDEWQKSSGLNALCAIEGEAGTRQPYFEACVAALDNARRRVGTEHEGAVAVHAYNAALAARAALRFEEAEELCTEGARRLEFTPANPWRLLVLQHLAQGRMTEAVEALGQMQRWRQRQPAYLRDQDRAETDVVFATVLLVAGETEMGGRAVDRAIAQPDRRGLTSGTREQALGAHALLRRAMTRAAAERAAEEASWSGFWDRLGGALSATGRRLDAWPDDERIRSVVADDDTLVATFRPFVRGGIQPVPIWLLGDLVHVLGPGVVSVAISEARAIEGPDSPVLPYLDALMAEVAWAQGDEARAISMAESALSRLPEREALFRARTAVVAAEAARSRGQNRSALSYYEQAMQADPGIIRRMGLAIPATVRVSSSGPFLADAADRIERSPRLTDDPGFEVQLSSPDGERMSACLISPSGARMGCAEVSPSALQAEYERLHAEWVEAVAERGQSEPEEGEGDGEDLGGEEADEEIEEPSPPDPPAALAEAFHDQIFSARVALASADLSSLDGRVTAGEEAARERMQDLLNHAMEQHR